MQKHSQMTDNPTLASKINQTTLRVKRAQYSDMTTVAALINSSAKWYEKFVDEKDMSEHRPDRVWIDKNFFRRQFYIGYDDDTAVGTISFQSIDSEHAYLGYIYLDVGHVGKGFGGQLMDHAKKLAEQAGKKGMVLIAHPEATWATRAYLKYGFKKIASERRVVLDWKKGALKSYYEEGFELYEYELY